MNKDLSEKLEEKDEHIGYLREQLNRVSANYNVPDALRKIDQNREEKNQKRKYLEEMVFIFIF